LIIEGRTPDVGSVEPSDLSEMLLRALVDSWAFSTKNREACFEMHKLAREIV
jgi:hypothetical protein